MAEEIRPAEARDQAAEWARGAGAILRAHAEREIEVDFKGDQDLVTSADRASEAFLVDVIRERHPDHAVLAEEGSGREKAARYRWLVDPLDGTTNFAHRYPFYAVSIALERAEAGRENAAGSRGPIIAAAVYDPVRDECWTAARGQGARLGGRPIRVSEVRALERGLAATGFPYDFKQRPAESLAYFESFLHETQAVRRDGSAALNLCYLACGRFDLFWELKLHAWDTAAAWLVIEEAGGRVTDFAGGAFDPFGIECAASNGALHPALLEVLGRYPRPKP